MAKEEDCKYCGGQHDFTQHREYHCVEEIDAFAARLNAAKMNTPESLRCRECGEPFTETEIKAGAIFFCTPCLEALAASRDEMDPADNPERRERQELRDWENSRGSR